MKFESLHDLYVEQLQDLYSAEKQLVEALPKMAKAASSSKLKQAFETHHKQTQEHVKRLEQLFEMSDAKPGNKKCKGMEGLIKEGEEMIEQKGDADTRDAGLIAAAQRVEHYEIAGYGTVRTYAEMLGEEKAARMLQQTLDEEGLTDKQLTQLAESSVNVKAAES